MEVHNCIAEVRLITCINSITYTSDFSENRFVSITSGASHLSIFRPCGMVCACECVRMHVFVCVCVCVCMCVYNIKMRWIWICAQCTKVPYMSGYMHTYNNYIYMYTYMYVYMFVCNYNDGS